MLIKADLAVAPAPQLKISPCYNCIVRGTSLNGNFTVRGLGGFGDILGQPTYLPYVLYCILYYTYVCMYVCVEYDDIYIHVPLERNTHNLNTD